MPTSWTGLFDERGVEFLLSVLFLVDKKLARYLCWSNSINQLYIYIFMYKIAMLFTLRNGSQNVDGGWWIVDCDIWNVGRGQWVFGLSLVTAL